MKMLSFAILLFLASCSYHDRFDNALGNKWNRLKSIWSEEEGFAKEDFNDEFEPFEESGSQSRFAEVAFAQPKEGGGIPSLDQFRKAFADLARIFQNVYFNTDDYILKQPEYMQTVDKIATYLKKHPNTYLSVGGHCDERQSEAYNLALGTKRSNFIRTLLIQKGVDPNKIYSISYGKEQPVDLGHNSGAWARNRRVEFRIYKK